jgi:hypothetical protein
MSMRSWLLVLPMAGALALGCGDDDRPGGGTDAGGVTDGGGGTDSGGGTDAGGSVDAGSVPDSGGGTDSGAPVDSGGGAADGGWSAAAGYFCTGFEMVCGFGGADRYTDYHDCATAYDSYSMDRQLCVANHLGMASGDATTHCPHAAGAAPCD